MRVLSTIFVLIGLWTCCVHSQDGITCDTLIDLTLIIDSSGSIPLTEFDEGKKALLDLVSRLNVAQNKANVALINYASEVFAIAESNVFESDQLQLMQRIGGLQHIGTRTATGSALDIARQICLGACRPLNLAVPRIFVVFTDGQSNEGLPVLPAAAAVRATPVEGTIFTVGIGNVGTAGRAELEGITGDPSYVLNIASYLDLARITNAISEKMCNVPAFVLPNTKILGEVKGNRTRYYRMNTLHKTAKNAFFEIEVRNQIGQVN